MSKKNENTTVKENRITFGSGFWSAAGGFFRAIFGIFSFAKKKQDRKMQEFPLTEEEHKENKPVRLIEVEIEKVDKTKTLLRKFKTLERRAKRLDKNIDELVKLPVIDLDYLNHLDKELEVEEKELEKELPHDLRVGVKKRFREKRKIRKEKRKNAVQG